MASSEAELEIATLAIGLGATDVGGSLSRAEARLSEQARLGVSDVKRRRFAELKKLIRQGRDPLGDMLSAARTTEQRRLSGAFYTENVIAHAMVAWVVNQGATEIVDCGAGSGRFSIAATGHRAVAQVIAIEVDPVACLVLRANCAVLGRTKLLVLNDDYTTVRLPARREVRGFVGNPPYVRHHSLTAIQKKRAQRAAAEIGLKLSGLAGLHVHFIVRTALNTEPRDLMCFITSAEWLDVNYGSSVRQLMTDGLRAEEIRLLDAKVPAFADATTSAVIVCARSGGVGESVRLEKSTSISSLTRFGTGGRHVARADLMAARSWSRLANRRAYTALPSEGSDFIPLGSIARVHRGAVTGANDFFVLTRAKADQLGLHHSVHPVLSSADEVIGSPGEVTLSPSTKLLFRPLELAVLPKAEREAVTSYLRAGLDGGVAMRYVPSHRKPWWRTQLLPAPPIVATYMARQAPVFALNRGGIPILNVLHGVYPLLPLEDAQLVELVATLNSLRDSYRGQGRTYQGGLEKFEPREMERLMIRRESAGQFSMLCDASD